MPTFSHNLEATLHRALVLAADRRHQYSTLEHLLLALTDDGDAKELLEALECDIPKLKRSVSSYLESELDDLIEDGKGGSEDPKPTAGFQRVIQRAVIHVQSSGREEVSGANVLVAMFAERESHAAYFLAEQDITRFDAVKYLIEKSQRRDTDTQTFEST